MAKICYRRHRFPPLIIQHAVWLYLRFSLSYRDVEELLVERGLDISYETVRCWVGGAGWTNVWLGTTTENQIEAWRRIPHLGAIPAAMRFLSVEPMLEPIDLSPWLGELDWLIVGGESGVGNRSRPMHPDWVRDLRDQARAAGGAFFLKQVGSNRVLWPGVKHRKGENPIEWPPDLQIQDLPC